MKGKLREKLSNVPIRGMRLAKSDFEQSDNTAGEETVVASYQAERPLALRAGEPFEMAVVAFESFTTDGTGGNSETFNLSNDLIDSPSVPTSFVLYEGGSVVQPDSVDYSANSFDYTDDGTNNDLYAFYATSEQAKVKVRKVSPSGIPEDLYENDAGLIARRDTGKSPLTMSFESELQPLIPTNWRLEVVLDAPYSFNWSDPNDDGATPINLLIDFPVSRASQKIEGLSKAVRADVVER